MFRFWTTPKVRYLAMTGVSAGITFGTLLLCRKIVGLSEQSAGAAALIAAFCVNFITVKRIVFRATGHWGAQLIKFAAVSATMRSVEYLMYLAMIDALGVPYVVALPATLLLSLSLKFTAYRRWVFREAN